MIDTIKTGAQVWLFLKPVRRVKKALNKRRAKKGKPLLTINNDMRDINMGKEIAGSVARTLLPAATAFLAGHGVEVSDGSSPLLVVGLALLVYGGMQAWSVARKVVNKPRDV